MKENCWKHKLATENEHFPYYVQLPCALVWPKQKSTRQKMWRMKKKSNAVCYNCAIVT